MIEEDASSFEPGVFEPTRRTLVRFEFGGGVFEDITYPNSGVPSILEVSFETDEWVAV